MIIATKSPLIDLFIRGLGTLGGAGGGSGIGSSSTGGRDVETGGGAGAGARSAGEAIGFLDGSAGDGRDWGFGAGAPAATSFIASTIRSVAPSSPSLPEPDGGTAETDAGGGNGLLRISVGRSLPDEEGVGGGGGEATALPGVFSPLSVLATFSTFSTLTSTGAGIAWRISVGRSTKAGCDGGTAAGASWA
jgi:hypothetical protein